MQIQCEQAVDRLNLLMSKFNLLMSKFKAKTREEERASGISPEIQEIDTLLEELCEKKEKAKNKPSTGNKKQSFQKEKATAEEMRLKAMETMGQTQKRVRKTNGVVPAKKSRKSTGDAIGYLKKKAEKELALKREKAGRSKRISIIGAANKNAARYAKDYSATTRRTAETAAEKPTANTTVYAVHVKPAAAAITGYVRGWHPRKSVNIFFCNFSLGNNLILHSNVFLLFLLEWQLISVGLTF